MERNITKEVIEKFEKITGVAIDIGCGEGYDSIYLIKNNWNVIAVDLFVEVIKKSAEKLDANLKDNLTIKRHEFENLDIPKVDLILANYSISYCKKEKFNLLINKIIESIKLNGRFAGIIYGEDDYRKDFEYMSFMTKGQFYKVFGEKFEIEIFRESKEKDIIKYNERINHTYEFIIRKIKE